MKAVLCLIAIFGGLLVRKSRELERLWLKETRLPPRAREPARLLASTEVGSGRSPPDKEDA
jgi:hypothetical protein